MPSRPRPLRLRSVFCAASAALVWLGCGPVQAQYKVIGPDGGITYTDRAPGTQEGTVTALGGRAAAAPADVNLPFELRQPASRYPVTLYVIPGNCEPCELARGLLRQRGVPYTEKRVQSTEDVEAMERLTGSRDTPTLTIGSQVVRGLTTELWTSYLDAAGYPRESRLPASYQPRPPTPVVERRAAVPVPPLAARAEPAPVRAPDRSPATSGGIRF